MRANIIIGPAYPLRGGIANLNEALCDNFNRMGIKSEIVSFSLQYPGFLFPGKTQYETSQVHHSFPIYTILNSINPLNWIRTARFIYKKKPDAVIIRYWLPFMAPCLGTIARWLRKKNITVIAITDNIIPHEKRAGDKLLTQYFINSCDGFLVMSEQVKTDIEKFTKTKPVVFNPHPIYNIFGDAVSKALACEKLNLPADKNYILFFGFIRRYKGLDLLIEAMAQVKDKNIKLIVAGEFYEDKSTYTSLLSQLKLANNIIIADNYIPKDAVKYYFSAADVVVQPYRHATQSGVAQIAYSFNKPMIVTNVGGLAEIVKQGQSGLVCEPTAESIAACINMFYEMNAHHPFAKNVENARHHFSWNKMIEKIITLYDEIA
jgi:glycosyltransferase involved in cell wall biosynthesis